MSAATSRSWLCSASSSFSPSTAWPLRKRICDRREPVRASFLPGPTHSVAEKLDHLKLHEIDLGPGAVLETGCVYIVPLMEELKLPADVAASANPKSSTGRLDIFTRVMTDHGPEFDQIPAGYAGPLYMEVSP
ncbi:MAG: 2'-deoxycytidine 5'-triphosphate deaminase, partial [Rhizobiales bacterium]|nr:2'-deoxycytidine 5'-triphosphate deaminase [Hyphomicrobiales bacterium]